MGKEKNDPDSTCPKGQKKELSKYDGHASCCPESVKNLNIHEVSSPTAMAEPLPPFHLCSVVGEESKSLFKEHARSKQFRGSISTRP